MPLQEDYQVTLDAFHGPLDLLLYLIRRAEVDVHDIPIATITDQYLAFLHNIEDIDVDMAGEFLVMAATLIEIKSRVLMPAEQRGGDDESGERPDETADPRYELVQQLLAYQKYRIASEELDKRRTEFANRFAARPTKAQRELGEEYLEPVELDLEDVHVYDLSEAYERIIAAIDLTRIGDHLVEIDETPIALHQEDLLDRLTRSEDKQLSLQRVFEDQPIGQRIGLFLATLELVRMRKVTVIQENIDDEVVLVLNGDPEEGVVTNDAGSAADRGDDDVR